MSGGKDRSSVNLEEKGPGWLGGGSGRGGGAVQLGSSEGGGESWRRDNAPCAVHAIRFSKLLSVVWAGAEKPAPIIRGLLCVKLELRTLFFCLKCKVRISYILL